MLIVWVVDSQILSVCSMKSLCNYAMAFYTHVFMSDHMLWLTLDSLMYVFYIKLSFLLEAIFS